MGDSRNVYIVPDDRAVIRTADVYQTEVEAGTAGYSDTLLAVVANFKNSGAPEGFNAQCMVGKSKRGEVALRLFAVIDPERKTFVRVGFKTRGCLAMTACASMICSMIEGKTFTEALAITPDDVKGALDGVPRDKIHTTYFATEGVRALIGDYLIDQGATTAQLDAVVFCDEFSIPCIVCEHCSLRDARIELRFTGAPQGDGAVSSSEEDEAARDRAERRALSIVFDDVRAQSARSVLVEPIRWVELDIVPEHMTADEFEMFVYEYLEEDRQERIEAEKAPAAPVCRTATRTVGVPQFFGREAAKEPVFAPEEGKDGKRSVSGQAPVEEIATAEGLDRTSASEPSDGDPFANLDIPAGYELVELEGEYVLVPTDDNPQEDEPSIESENIVVLVGAHSYYLYASDVMTDAYAHWAFLAAEDDRVVTFVDCVREDSRVYPRPLAASSLKNPPFSLDDDEIAQAWDIVRESGEYPDIRQTVASNGDVYYYSTEYLSPVYAASLAEWDAVERRQHL